MGNSGNKKGFETLPEDFISKKSFIIFKIILLL